MLHSPASRSFCCFWLSTSVSRCSSRPNLPGLGENRLGQSTSPLATVHAPRMSHLPETPAESAPAPTSTPPVRSWRDVKSRRGAPKRINTQGFECPNPDCHYHNDTAAQHHALVGNGHHGQAEPIQDLRCQACKHKFTVRRDAPLYRLKTSAARVALVLTALAEGLSVSGAVHTFGHRERTPSACTGGSSAIYNCYRYSWTSSVPPCATKAMKFGSGSCWMPKPKSLHRCTWDRVPKCLPMR